MDDQRNFDLSSTTDFKGHGLLALNISGLVLSTTFLLARLGTRTFIVKNLGLDDVICAIAWVSLVALSAMDIRGEF
jgi:hypothetical protein